jgi:hypothetical protein
MQGGDLMNAEQFLLLAKKSERVEEVLGCGNKRTKQTTIELNEKVA